MLSKRFVAVLAIVFLLGVQAAVAQTGETPPPAPEPSPTTPPLPAGTIPASIWLDVTGTPATEPDVLDAQIRAALDREIRPTLRPGSGVRYGPIVPWPLTPLAAGSRAAVNVTVTIAGDATSSAVQGVTTVNLNSVLVPPVVPRVLFLSDDPEYLRSEGLIFRGDVTPARPARLYYYHSDLGLPRDLDVVLTAAVPSRVQLIESSAGPDLDVMSVGHTVSRDFLRFAMGNEGVVVAVDPGRPLVVHHRLVLQSEVVAGAVDLNVASGAVSVSVVATPAGGRPEPYLAGPRVAFDGHNRHGTFALDGYGDLAQAYVAGGPDASVRYGDRAPTPRNLDPADSGRDYGDYGVVHRIAFSLRNPTDVPQLVYLYERPLGGPVRSTFIVDGQLKEIGCARMPQPYLVWTYQLPPQSSGLSTTLTMTDGGSFYPLEFGVTATKPIAYPPPVGTPEGCSPNVTPFPDSAASPVRN